MARRRCGSRLNVHAGQAGSPAEAWAKAGGAEDCRTPKEKGTDRLILTPLGTPATSQAAKIAKRAMTPVGLLKLLKPLKLPLVPLVPLARHRGQLSKTVSDTVPSAAMIAPIPRPPNRAARLHYSARQVSECWRRAPRGGAWASR